MTLLQNSGGFTARLDSQHESANCRPHQTAYANELRVPLLVVKQSNSLFDSFVTSWVFQRW